MYAICGGVSEIGIRGNPKMVGLKGQFLLKWMIWGYPYFRKPLFTYIWVILRVHVGKYFIHRVFGLWTLVNWFESMYLLIQLHCEEE